MAEPKWEDTSPLEPTWESTSAADKEFKRPDRGVLERAGNLASGIVTGPAYEAYKAISGKEEPIKGYTGWQKAGDIVSGNYPAGEQVLAQEGAPQGDSYDLTTLKKALGHKVPGMYLLPDKMTGRQYLGGTLDTIAGMLGGKALSTGGNALGNMAESAANKATISHIRPTPKVRLALGKEKLNDIAKEVRDSGAMTFGSKAEGTAANLENLLQETGQLKGDITAASTSKINTQDVVKQLDDEIARWRTTSVGQKYADHLENVKENFLKQYGNELSPLQSEAEKAAVQGEINYSSDPTNKQKADMAWARVLKNTGENAIKEPGFIPSKRAYGNLKAAQGMVDRTAALTDGGLMAHIADVGIDTAALDKALEGNLMGAPVVAARGLTKGRVASSLGVSLDALSKGLKGQKSTYDALLRNLINKGQNQ